MNDLKVHEKLYKKLYLVINKLSEKEIKTLVKNLDDFDKLDKKMKSQSIEDSMKDLIKLFKKDNVRSELIKIIDNLIPPFTDYKWKRDNSLIRGPLEKIFVNKAYKSYK